MAKVLNAHHIGSQAHRDRIYIGRPSVFGNPFVIGRDGDRAEVIAKYEKWVETQPLIKSAVPRLVGKDLVCWCAPLPCHGDVLLRMAEKFACEGY
ncbi:DUF4326 domain-containing protein [Rhizobium rhizogenes]|uniref:DUF4326 domain-containing protein n=1 Tax=Rhizobium rhizogenes TaxID=359 RepID=UPI0024BE8998|nr:DUF4326 domain-containing protein [Rhizobium rhizogenes]MDJ1632705.1 DUF4326 domain-containing protein [Rhizobium rhizogenes]